MAIIDNPIVVGGAVDQTSALKYMLEHKTNYAGIAAGLTTLTELPTFTQPSGVQVFSSMFDGCSALTTVPTLTYPSTGNTSFEYMFRNCTSLTSVPSVDIGRAKNTTGMFYGCANMVGDFIATKTANNTNAEEMFRGCSHIENVVVTKSPRGSFSNLLRMFYNCTSLETVNIPVTGGGTTGACIATSMFDGCKLLTTVTLDASSAGLKVAGGISAMFNGCEKLETINISTPIDVSMCQEATTTFYGCAKLTSIPSIINTGNITLFNNFLNGCTELVDFPNSFDMHSATSSTSLRDFAAGCSSLSNNSLNNILGSLLTWGGSANKKLKYIGLTSSQATTCTSLSNWSALSAAGWTTGY